MQVGRNDRILLKGGMVLTLDRNLGDFETADVLVEGKKIVAVQPNLKAEAQIIDASNTIVMPGFIDTHHHQYETILRNILADGLLAGPKSYQSEIQAILTPATHSIRRALRLSRAGSWLLAATHRPADVHAITAAIHSETVRSEPFFSKRQLVRANLDRDADRVEAVARRLGELRESWAAIAEREHVAA